MFMNTKITSFNPDNIIIMMNERPGLVTDTKENRLMIYSLPIDSRDYFVFIAGETWRSPSQVIQRAGHCMLNSSTVPV